MAKTIPYNLSKGLGGKIRVKYACPHCADVLENELAEAGQKDTCPSCARPFIVPGEAKRKEVEAELRQKAEQRRIAQEQAQKEQAEQAAAAARQAELDAEREKKSLEALQVQQEINAQRAAAKREENQKKQLVTASNTEYYALRSYVDLCRVIGWSCIIIPVVAALGTMAVGIVAGLFSPNDNTPAAIGAVVATGTLAAIGGLAIGVIVGFPFFIAGQLIQLALDARTDLAKLVEQKQLDG